MADFQWFEFIGGTIAGGIAGWNIANVVAKDKHAAVDPKTSTADPEIVRQEIEAKAAYDKIREERKRQEAAVEEQRKAAEAAARAEKQRQEAAERAERDRIAAEEKAERDRIAAEEKAERDRMAAIEQAERDRIASIVAAERAEWERTNPRPEPPKQLRRTYEFTRTVQVKDPAELQDAIRRCISSNAGGFLSAGFSPDPPQVTSDGLTANISFFSEQWE